MGGIFGVFHRDGRAVSSELLSAMRARMHGPAAGVWCEGACGLGQVSAADPRDPERSSGPLVIADARLVTTATARLDARDELCDALDVPSAERRQIADAALVSRAFLRWGEATPEHLAGDWAYAIWRADTQTLSLARDQQGSTTVYTCVTDRHVAWASSVLALLALPFVSRRLDETHLARVLTSWASPIATCFADVERIPLGSALTITATEARTRRYFDLAAIPPLRLASNDEYVEALRVLLARAVADRLPPDAPAAIALSGGLDSGAVAATAGQLRAPGAPPLAAISHVPRFRQPMLGPRVADEAPLVAATARAVGIGEVIWLDSAHISPLWGMRRALEINGAPALAPSNQFWLFDLLATARDHGYGALFTGQLGNVTVSWQGKPDARHWCAHFRRRDLRSGLAALLPESWGARLRAARRGGRGATPWREYSAIRPEFAARLQLAERMAAEDHDPTFARTHSSFDQRVQMLRSASGELTEAGAAHGVDIRDPTADLRIVRFCLSIPEAQFLGPRGEGRWLIRRAMSGLLPPAVLWNRRRGLQSSDLVLRLRADAASVDAVIEACAADRTVAEYVDVPYLRDVWARVRARHDLATHREAVAVLCRGLMVGMFLMG